MGDPNQLGKQIKMANEAGIPVFGGDAPDFRTFLPIQNQNSNKIRSFNLKGQCSALEKDTT